MHHAATASSPSLFSPRLMNASSTQISSKLSKGWHHQAHMNIIFISIDTELAGGKR